MTTCKKCGAPIIFIKTKKGKWMPCDEGLVEYKAGDGPNFDDVVVDQNGNVIHCTFDFQCVPDGLARIPHWATCPYAEDFRR